MNLKSIRKDYEHLNALERLSLLDNAISRDDESEIKAIVAASPRKTFSQPDYVEMFEKITKIRFCNLIVRLGYVMDFELFLRFDSESEDDSISNNTRLIAYLYVRATDAWKAVSDELCLRVDYEKEIGKIFIAVGLLFIKDGLLREIAFTETEAKDYIEKRSGDGKIQTLADEIKAMRETLGLPSK